MRWRIAVVEEITENHEHNERDVRYERECPNEVDADDHTDWSKYVEHRKGECARQFRRVAAQSNQTDEDNEECRENAGIRELNDVEHRDAAGNEGNEYGADERDEVRRTVFRVNIRHCLRQEAVTRHREEDACLTKNVDDEGRDHTEENADRYEVCKPRVADEAEAVGNRIGAVKIRIVDRTREDKCHDGVNAETDKDRGDDADGETLLRCLALLRGGRNRIKAHEGEEHHRCARHDAGSAEGQERLHVLRQIHVRGGDDDECDDRAQRERDENRIEARTLLRTVREDETDHEGNDDGGEVDDTTFWCRREERLWNLHPEGRHHS